MAKAKAIKKGPLPSAKVKKPASRDEEREGRGFSRGELERVRLSLKEARALGIRVDPKRKSVHEENVEALREWLGPSKKPA